MTEEEKEKIDYEIQAKINARNKDLGEWGCSGLLAILTFLLIVLLLTAMS